MTNTANAPAFLLKECYQYSGYARSWERLLTMLPRKMQMHESTRSGQARYHQRTFLNVYVSERECCVRLKRQMDRWKDVSKDK